MLLGLYQKHVISIVEYAAPVWNSGLTNSDKNEIERVQKTALSVIFYQKSYTKKLEMANLDRLGARRDGICQKFAIKTAKNPKFENWFKHKQNPKNTRQKNQKYDDPKFRCERFRNSPIPFLTRLLNKS